TEPSRETGQPSRTEDQNQPQQPQDQQQQGQDQQQQQAANQEAPSFPGPAETQLAAGGGTADPAGKGDFLGRSYNRIITVPFPQTFVTATRTVFVASPVGFNTSTGQILYTPAYPVTQGSRTTQVVSSLQRVVRVFIESQGAFKFADNESPQPQD